MSSRNSRPLRSVAAYKCSDSADCGRIYPVSLGEDGRPDIGGMDLRCPACCSVGRDTGYPIEHFKAKRQQRSQPRPQGQQPAKQPAASGKPPRRRRRPSQQPSSSS